ncbi:hypothetical protein [Bacteriovorax sp. BAL6_X]|uniref:hypothetical protein n=1 Tax=Bacteriovorax sp. BAL6_X TaxID=1201290 RepID=UPI0012EE9EAF|nr:hypothetical protein [Bacteriovorax sp. BAL6_X]
MTLVEINPLSELSENDVGIHLLIGPRVVGKTYLIPWTRSSYKAELFILFLSLAKSLMLKFLASFNLILIAITTSCGFRLLIISIAPRCLLFANSEQRVHVIEMILIFANKIYVIYNKK